MIKENNNVHDTQGERIERLALLSANIDDFAVDVGVAGVRLTAAQNAKEDYLNAIATAGVEDGEELNSAIDAASDYYVAAKDHLLTIIWELDKPDDFIEAYSFRGRSISVPDQGSKTLKHPLLRRLIRDIGLSIDEYNDSLGRKNASENL